MGDSKDFEIAELRSALEAQAALIDRMRDRLATIEHSEQATAPPAVTGQETASRRGMLRMAVAGLGGAGAAIVAGAAPAAAADGDAVTVGTTRTVSPQSGAPTAVNFAGGDYWSSGEHVFQVGEAAVLSDFPSAILGYSTGSAASDGVYGLSDAPEGFGITGEATDANGVGVVGFSPNIGVLGGGEVYDLYAGGLGVIGSNPSGVALPPTSGDWSAGDLVHGASDYWVCVASGSPGVWRKLASTDTAGALHPIAPIRVYDSRWAGGAPIAGGQTRTIPCRDSKNGSGGVIAANVVPAGAIAVVLNVTVTVTTGGGFLKVYPANVAAPASSAINWFASNQTIANGMTIKVDPTRQIKVTAGGTKTHFIVDVTGYYR